MPSFTTRLDERLEVAGSPLPADVDSIRTDLLSINTTIEGSSQLKGQMQSYHADQLLNWAELVAKDYADA